MKNCIVDLNNAELSLGDSVSMTNMRIAATNARIVIGPGSILEGHEHTLIMLKDGELHVGSHSRLRASIVVRFGGVCRIGDYNAINEETEIRCDEAITIGSFNMISYRCQINDTNTHNLLPIEERRQRTIHEYPVIGSEVQRPPTEPVQIGDDCWMGKGATILKGVTIGDRVVISTQAVVTKSVPSFSIVAGNPATVVKQVT